VSAPDSQFHANSVRPEKLVDTIALADEGGWPTQALFWLEWGISATQRVFPQSNAARRCFSDFGTSARASGSASLTTRFSTAYDVTSDLAHSVRESSSCGRRRQSAMISSTSV